MTTSAFVTATREGVLRELAGPPLEALRAALQEAAFDSAEIHGRKRGGTSTCYYLRAPGGEHLVFKRPLADEDLCHEFALLRRAQAATLPVHLPKPLAELSDGHGYLMERISGEPLRSAGSLAEPAVVQRTAVALLEALDAWHGAIGEPYGDFHAANVLLGASGRLKLIDPGESTDVSRAASVWPPARPLVTDLGLWVHNCALDAPAMWLRQPHRAIRLRAFALELVSLAGQRDADPVSFVRAVFERAALHGGRLWRDPWPARRARAPFVRLALLELRRASLATVTR